MIRKLRQQRKIGPGGGGPVSEIELGLVQRTNKRVGTFSAGMPNEKEIEEASKFLRYSNLLIQKGRMQRAGDKQGERLTDIEIEKEKKKLGIKDEFIPEGMMKRLIGAVQDKLSKEGGAAGFADLAKAAKSMGVTLTKDMF